MSGLGDWLDAAFSDGPPQIIIDHTVLPRDENGKWQEARLDQFGRPIVQVDD